jgi:hypothetical protein
VAGWVILQMHVLELFSSAGVRYIGPSQKAPNIVVIAIFELVCVDNQTASFPALALDVDLLGLYFSKSASRCLEKRGELSDAPLSSPKLTKLVPGAAGAPARHRGEFADPAGGEQSCRPSGTAPYRQGPLTARGWRDERWRV